MAASEYDKYFITETPRHREHPQSRDIVSDIPWCDSLVVDGPLDGGPEGAFYLETCMVLRAGSVEELEVPHTHDFDEYLLFIGTNPEDQFDLGAEVEMWVGDEKRVLTKTTAVFVPAGVSHCPLVVHSIERPFIFITTGNQSEYERSEEISTAEE